MTLDPRKLALLEELDRAANSVVTWAIKKHPTNPNVRYYLALIQKFQAEYPEKPDIKRVQ